MLTGDMLRRSAERFAGKCGMAKARCTLMLREPLSGKVAERIGLVAFAVEDVHEGVASHRERRGPNVDPDCSL